jgi:anaerobic magnesium-protoporphyrin IX monomethyl ester cyclase
MSFKLLLVSSPLTLEQRYGRLAWAGSTQPSFGLACLAAVARESGVEVRLLDAAAENLSVAASFQEVMKFEPDMVGIGSTTAGIVASGDLAARIKNHRPHTLIVVGGCHATALPEETLSEFSGFDVAVIGEGEATFLEMLSSIKANGSIPDNLAGTAVRSEGKVLSNKPREYIRILDELPLPAWSLFRNFPHAFCPSPARVKRYPCASVVLTRGCPNRCVFCDRSVFGNFCRSYSPKYAVAMFKDLRENYGVKEILVEDDTFVLVKRRVQEFCERLIAEKVDVSWSCLGRADQVALDLLKIMRRAGCWHISYGIESGNADILAAMGKNLEIQQIERAVRWSKEAGLRTKGFFMVGFPGESQASLAETRKMVKSLPLDDISVMQVTPFPGSELFAIADQLGTFERDWTKMTTLETVFIPHGLTRKDLETASTRLVRDFYLQPRKLLAKLAQALLNPRLAWRLVKAFGAWVRTFR